MTAEPWTCPSETALIERRYNAEVDFSTTCNDEKKRASDRRGVSHSLALSWIALTFASPASFSAGFTSNKESSLTRDRKTFKADSERGVCFSLTSLPSTGGGSRPIFHQSQRGESERVFEGHFAQTIKPP